ncbi:DegQ family serine endoprotease [Alysiella crassa]|uniref:Probable periplasmic serine endoprotease DegP-like n=1 Tax=Alysiella crassa TaxID=153491 RepID=A0A376BKK1_9NEIS|nr:DegQ family serine endoprotease [Alysiella crassa]UOP07608.1 DegQ family serine endoprotease [Alysiella crassa]SSY70168.1 Probable periplasmic serine endoprotease DegP-like precursor [Alysiella crassa]
MFHQKKWLPVAVCMALVLTACPDKKNTNTSENVEATPAASQPASEFVKKVEPQEVSQAVGMLLPDFAELVAREGGSVVNIQAMKTNNNIAARQSDSLDGLSKDDPFYEFFKRLVPHDPNMPEMEEDDYNFGSGVIISKDGYILTNTHVIKDLNKIKVTLNDKREYEAKLIGSDDKSDIALLKIDAPDLPIAKIGKAEELKSGEWVAAIGAPFGFDNSVTAGIVSAKGRSLPNEHYTPFIQTDVAINPGNSGGPLFNLRGQVVGINSQIYSRSGGFMGISFAIPIDVAMNVAEQLKTTGKVERGQLGVIIQEVTYDLSKSFGLDKPTGALVARILPDSPAQRGGLQVGDIIRSVNGNQVRSSSELPMAIGGLPPEKEVILGVWRKGKELNLIVKLGSASDGQQAATSQEPLAVELQNQGAGFEVPLVGLLLSVESKGLMVTRATGLAQAAGLRRGDLILEIGGSAVRDQASFNEAMVRAGKNVSVLVQRGGDTVFLALVLP